MTATNLVNDGATTTNIVEATLSGSSGSNVVIKNDGTITVAEYISSTLTTLFQVITGTGLKLGAVGRQTEVIGNLLVDGTATITGALTTAVTATSAAISGTVTAGSLASSGAITGTTLVTTGAITGSKVNFTTGGITAVTSGTTGTIATNGGTVTVTHGLGFTPDVVLITDVTGGPATQSLSVTSIGATTFVITNNAAVALAAQAACWVAFKF